ncbi:MAG: alpha-hydroxy acid oxidase [Anaerolineae bacterium]|nr:alpha-hydroxy acid oxidase [Anaerolineae bacterium]
MTYINLNDYAKAAKEHLTPAAYEYYVGGAGDNLTVSENQAAFQRIKLLPRMLVDVSNRDLQTSILGHGIDFPVIVAPTAMAALAHPDKEVAIARAVANVGSIMTLSTMSTTSMEEVSKIGANMWFQLYVHKDRGMTKNLIERAEAAGFSALVVTVDLPVVGYREALMRQPLVVPDGMELANLAQYWNQDEYPSVNHYVAAQFDPSLTWADIEDFVSSTTLPVLIKGILRPDDAERAVASGASGIIVSNHGGRQLDTVVTGIEALPYVVEAVDDAIDVLMDGGVRRGTDILKALALGANAVLIGRPVLWGLAVDGQAGVEKVFAILRKEYDIALANAGVQSSKSVPRDIIFKG